MFVDLVPAAAGNISRGGNAVFQTVAYHQCVWWADQKRPDIWLAATAHGVPGDGYVDAITGDAWWDAWRWASNAAQGGLPEGHVPVTGAIVVFPKTSRSPYGHVAYVMSVYPTGGYHVSEYNRNVPLGYDERDLPAPVAGDGLIFIYGGPAGDPSFATVNGPPASGQTQPCTALQGGCAGPIQGGSGNPQGGTSPPIQGGGPGSGGGPPPPPPPPPPESIQIGWSSSHPGWIWMTLTGFSANSYQYSCDFGSGGDAAFTLTETGSPETWDNGHTCYDLIRGDTVWVTVGSIQSNTIVVP